MTNTSKTNSYLTIKYSNANTALGSLFAKINNRGLVVLK